MLVFLEPLACMHAQLLAAAKSLQSCPTLCDPIDGSPPGSPVSGILHVRTLEWVAINLVYLKDSEKTDLQEPEIKLPTSTGSLKKQENSKKHLLLLY